MHLDLRAVGRDLRHGLARLAWRCYPWPAVVLVGALQVIVLMAGTRVINWALAGRPLLPSYSPRELAFMLGGGVIVAASMTLVNGLYREHPRSAMTTVAGLVLTVGLVGWGPRVAQLGILRAAALTAWLVLVLAGGAALIALLRHPDAYRRTLVRSRDRRAPLFR